jgi:hypothetical protein
MTPKGFFISPGITPDAMTIPNIRYGPRPAVPPVRRRIPAAHASSRQARTPRPPGSERLLAAKGDPLPHHQLRSHNATAMSCHTLLFRGFAGRTLRRHWNFTPELGAQSMPRAHRVADRTTLGTTPCPLTGRPARAAAVHDLPTHPLTAHPSHPLTAHGSRLTAHRSSARAAGAHDVAADRLPPPGLRVLTTPVSGWLPGQVARVHVVAANGYRPRATGGADPAPSSVPVRRGCLCPSLTLILGVAGALGLLQRGLWACLAAVLGLPRRDGWRCLAWTLSLFGGEAPS